MHDHASFAHPAHAAHHLNARPTNTPLAPRLPGKRTTLLPIISVIAAAFIGLATGGLLI